MVRGRSGVIYRLYKLFILFDFVLHEELFYFKGPSSSLSHRRLEVPKERSRTHLYHTCALNIPGVEIAWKLNFIRSDLETISKRWEIKTKHLLGWRCRACEHNNRLKQQPWLLSVLFSLACLKLKSLSIGAALTCQLCFFFIGFLIPFILLFGFLISFIRVFNSF